MKNFTLFLLFLAFIMLTFVANSQNKDDLLNKFQQAHEKNSKIIQKAAHFSRILKAHTSNGELLPFKSAAAKQKLDSTISTTMNAETHLWQNDYKDEFLYDSELKNTTLIGKEWNLSNNAWNVVSDTELGYDNSDRINSVLMNEGDSLIRFLIFYNPGGMQDSVNWYSTENAGVSWNLFAKTINQYNTAKQLTKADIQFSDEDGNLVLISTVYTYTGTGKISTSNTSYVMEGFELPSSKTEYSYDGSDRLITVENSASNNGFPPTLVKSTRTMYQYNSSGNISVEINSTWNGTSWIDVDKTDYNYNTSTDVSDAIYSNWNGTAWIADSKEEFTYGTTNFSDVVFPSYEFIANIFSSFVGFIGNEESTDFFFNKIPTVINSFQMLNANWTNTDKTVYYYSSGTSTNIDESSNTLFNVYPNPASNSVSFRWKGNYDNLTLEMYQITGVKALEQIAYPGRLVSISKLENGIYFFKLLKGQQVVHTGKLIKE